MTKVFSFMKRSLNKHHIIYKIIISAALVSCLSGCRSSKHKNEVVVEETVVVKESKRLKGERKKIVEETMTWIGTPYKYAGSDKKNGTDCSGMVVRVYEDVTGTKLPRNSKQQSEFCTKLKSEDVKPGDLVFFATGKSSTTVSHVGIMIDNNRFVHSSTKKGVILSEMTTPYYQRTFIMFGRVPDVE